MLVLNHVMPNLSNNNLNIQNRVINGFYKKSEDEYEPNILDIYVHLYGRPIQLNNY